MMGSQPRVPMVMAKPSQQARSMSIGPGSMGLNANATSNGGSGEKGTGGPAPGILSTRPGSVQAVPTPAPLVSSTSVLEHSSQGGVIPRANCFPKPAGLRPRSRSFSGFDTSSGVPLPECQKGKRLVYFFYFFYRISETDPSLLDDVYSGDDSEISTARDVQRSLTTTGTSSNSNSHAKSTPASFFPTVLRRYRHRLLEVWNHQHLRQDSNFPAVRSPSPYSQHQI
jgi:hypothetical protein